MSSILERLTFDGAGNRRTESIFVDAAAEIERLKDELARLKHRFYTLEDVAEFMGNEMPIPSSPSNADVPWVKKLRELSHCTLREAKHAHDLCVAARSLKRKEPD